MSRTAVLVVHGKPEPIATELAGRLRESSRFALYSNRLWTDLELQAHLGRHERTDWAVAVLICPAEQNEVLSRALRARQPELVVVRIDIGTRGAAETGHIKVDLAQHLQLDPQRVGFERLLATMHYLLEHSGAGDAQRLARYLVLEDPASIDPDGVMLVEVSRPDSAPPRTFCPAAIKWLNALLRDHVDHMPRAGDEPGSFFMSRDRAIALLKQLDSKAREPNRELSHAQRELAAVLDNPTEQLEPLALLKRRLGLTLEDVHSLIVCIGPELDLAYQLIYAYVQDDMSRRYATLGLLDALRPGQGGAAALASVSSLLRWRLLESDRGRWPPTDQPLRVDPPLLQWLLVGGDALLGDPMMKSVVLAQEWRGRDLVTERADLADQQYLLDMLCGSDINTRWCVLAGADPEGWRAGLERAAARADKRLLRVALARFAALDANMRDETAIRISRSALIMARPLAVDCGTDAVDASALLPLVEAHADRTGTSMLIAADARPAASVLPHGKWAVRMRALPSLESRTHHFRIALETLGATPADEGDALAERLATAYPLSVEGLHNAAALAIADLPESAAPEEKADAFAAACRRVAAPDILRLARRIEPLYDLDDVIVPKDRKALLEEIVANTQHTRTVLEDWGFGAQLAYGRGVAALFAGPSGTGKTMAAQAIARRLGVDVFAVDLSRIVSKYIGETEKHLDSVIVDAERSGSVLLFDEADALFGKRSEVKDAHDRYANIEVAYLLQRMEAFSGLAILTTNSRQNLDPAFLRRLRFVVDFPRPDAAARQEIWRKCLPASAPLAPDIDWRMLARFELSGGVIRQITLRAAFLAAQVGSARIEMTHLLTALRAELNQLGMQAAERELAELERLRPVKREEAA